MSKSKKRTKRKGSVVMTIEEFGRSKNFYVQKFKAFALDQNKTCQTIRNSLKYYNQVVLENIGNKFLESQILPHLEQKLRDSGVDFDYAVITDDLIRLALGADRENTKVAIFIYSPVEKIKKDYGLVGLKLFATELAEIEGYDMTSVYKRLKAGVVRKKIKPVAYGMKLNPVYTKKSLMSAYKSELKKRQRVAKRTKVEE